MPLSQALVTKLQNRLGTTQRTWLVTGAAGFIGSNLVEALITLGQKVVGLDNFATGRRANLHDVERAVGEDGWARFRFVEGDIRDLAVCQAACDGANVVLHQAALGSVPRSIADPITTNHVNIGGHLNMLVAARDQSVSRFVYAASSSTYGDSPFLPKVEHRIGNPLSPYAVSKYVNELYADVFARTYRLPTIGLRYFNVFGPRQDPNGQYAAVIPRWIATLMRGDRCHINGDGSTTRDFCFVQNVVQANVLAALATAPEAVNEVYNVAVGSRTSLVELHAALCEGLARETGDKSLRTREPEFTDFRPGDVLHSQADIGKARRLLGYEPTHDIRAGLAASMSWYAANLATALPAATPNR
jgi:UDP-N-acetylglucosamine 4-epimerase